MFFDFTLQTPAQIEILKIASHSITPMMVLENLSTKALLESAYQETGKGRYSLLLLSLSFCLTKENNTYYLLDDKEKITLNPLDETKDFLDWAETFKNLAPTTLQEDIPLPLGGIGYLGFEFFEEIETLKNHKPKKLDTYDCALMFGRDFLIFDHLYDCAFLISINYAKETHPLNLKEHIQNLATKIKQLTPKPLPQENYNFTILPSDQEEYFITMVETIKKEIYQGNLLQCVPSQTLQIQSNLPPIQAYKRLRQNNPSPYMFYFDFENFQILGTSPEMMIKIENESITIRPIAGTRKRGKTIAQDLQLEQELKEDEKENAEHLMLVDLARNDIGKVAKIGSIKIEKFKIIERYSKVMHIVSEVKGEFDQKKKSCKDAIFATFPAGTVSGAPKIQAIKTLYTLEKYQRGIYGGLIGYFDTKGNFDSAIAIRTAIYQNQTYHLQAGAGVVQDSLPEFELKETKNKMLALLSAITESKE
ncbi:anthranilate synthase component I family protein [Helicobacter anatolicus]|uniref:anthranilate synthase component I family protein n=1 Tax=Helicobacter anatolicus TaxID=2905874 RepID=UPI001E3894BE|nr:chorismate-binding protein [Helicobacter anatolicus]MCE3038422.1 chorismate-binding protein [Helicobacter anatolicus]